MKWEYLTEVRSYCGPIDKYLNKLGRLRWELCAVYVKGEAVVYCFKRKKKNKQ